MNIIKTMKEKKKSITLIVKKKIPYKEKKLLTF